MWLGLSLLYAFAVGAQNAYFKKRSIRLNPVLVTWSVLVVSTLLVSPLFLFGVPHIGDAFWPAILWRLVIDSLAFTLYVKAIQMSPLSLTVPMLSLQTLGIFITQFFINHLVPAPLGVLGVAIVVFGVYFLHFDHKTRHPLSPFKAIYKEKGVLLIVIVAILWSVVTAL